MGEDGAEKWRYGVLANLKCMIYDDDWWDFERVLGSRKWMVGWCFNYQIMVLPPAPGDHYCQSTASIYAQPVLYMEESLFHRNSQSPSLSPALFSVPGLLFGTLCFCVIWAQFWSMNHDIKINHLDWYVWLKWIMTAKHLKRAFKTLCWSVSNISSCQISKHNV